MVDESKNYEHMFDTLKAQIESLEQEKMVQAQNYMKMKEISEMAMQRLQQNEEAYLHQQAEFQSQTRVHPSESCFSSPPYSRDMKFDF